MSEIDVDQRTGWCLSGRPDEASSILVIEIDSTPFRIGRSHGSSLTLPSAMVSNVHAEINANDDGSLWIRDLQSTNGTYVNGRPVTDKERLGDGDLIQCANVAFRLSRACAEVDQNTQVDRDSNYDQAISLVQFDKLLSERAVIPHYQPIVSLPSKEAVGYEVLARSRIFGLQSPKDMFLAASQLNLEEELSRMLRVAGLETGARIPPSLAIYLNTHPAEIVTFGLRDSLRQLRKSTPDQMVTLEVHEAAATDPEMMEKLRDDLTSLDMKLAFDDFGAGQSRLMELAKVGPDLVKFDIHLIRDIHLAPSRQHQLLASLVRMVRDLDIVPLAEGVECEGEHEFCCNVGFELAQGYFYGKPAAIPDALSQIDAQSLPA